MHFGIPFLVDKSADAGNSCCEIAELRPVLKSHLALKGVWELLVCKLPQGAFGRISVVIFGRSRVVPGDEIYCRSGVCNAYTLRIQSSLDIRFDAADAGVRSIIADCVRGDIFVVEFFFVSLNSGQTSV